MPQRTRAGSSTQSSASTAALYGPHAAEPLDMSPRGAVRMRGCAFCPEHIGKLGAAVFGTSADRAPSLAG